MNAPVYGCDGCATTGGRLSCGVHGGVASLGVASPLAPAAPEPLSDADLALLREQAAEANPAYWVPKLLDEIARLREVIATER